MHSVLLNQISNYDLKAKNAFQEQRASIMSEVASGRLPLQEVGEIPIKYLDFTRLPGVDEVNIMTPSKTYKPFQYEYGYHAWLRQNQMHWLPEEVPLGPDCRDWSKKLNDSERNLMTHIFRLFVQNDMLVHNAYIHEYAQTFQSNCLQMAFSGISNMEVVHQVGYAHLLDTLGIPETEYSAFLEYKEMADKYNFTAGFRMDTLMGIAVAMLVFGALTEGLQLFASFAVLMNFPRQKKLKGMGQIVSWSVRDETLHVSFIARLFKTFMIEFGHLIDTNRLAEAGEEACRKIVAGECKFTDLAFEMGGVEGMTPDDHKIFIHSTADARMKQFGMKPLFGELPTPYPWFDKMTGGVELANFFEQRSSSYSRAATKGTWDDAWRR